MSLPSVISLPRLINEPHCGHYNFAMNALGATLATDFAKNIEERRPLPF